jgi:class 3 adenylate cyclase
LLITGETRDDLRASDVMWEERPAMPLKGKRRAVTLYAPPRAHTSGRVSHTGTSA